MAKLAQSNTESNPFRNELALSLESSLSLERSHEPKGALKDRFTCKK